MIRRAEEKDISGILGLLRQVLMVHHHGRPDIFKADSQKYNEEDLLNILGDDSRPVFVAVEQEKVLGYVFCIFQQHRDHSILTDIKTLYIDDLCVDESTRGAGVGRAIYKEICRYAKMRGCSAITLCGHLLDELNKGKLRKILFCGTGALLSPTSTQQGLPIPGVCHAVCIHGRD